MTMSAWLAGEISFQPACLGLVAAYDFAVSHQPNTQNTKRITAGSASAPRHDAESNWGVYSLRAIWLFDFMRPVI
jgi:hypothetical protein